MIRHTRLRAYMDTALIGGAGISHSLLSRGAIVTVCYYASAYATPSQLQLPLDSV